MKRYEFPFCSVAAPDDWVPVPPLGLAEPRQREGRLSLRVAEEWLDQPASAADHNRKQRDLLATALEDFELVREGAFPSTDPRSGSLLVFDYENEDRLTSREMRVVLAQGPRVCTLTLQGPGGESRLRDQVFDAVARSFELRNGELLARAEQVPLLDALDRGAPPPPDPTAYREKFPRVCISLSVPRGWDARREKSSVLLQRSGAEIRIRRILEHGGEPGTWFTERMKQLRDNAGSVILQWYQGALPDGRRYAAILSDETARSRSWTTAATQRTLDVALTGDQPLEWTLRAPVSSFQDFHALFVGVIAGAVFLDPAEWETCPAEEWIDLVLQGPWNAEGPGTYSCMNGRDMLLLQLNRVESHSSIEALRPRLLESLRRAAAIQRNTSEEETPGLFRGLDALRYSGKGRMAVRAIWVRSGENLYSGTLNGTDPGKTDELIKQIAAGLRLPGMRDAA